MKVKIISIWKILTWNLKLKIIKMNQKKEDYKDSNYLKILKKTILKKLNKKVNKNKKMKKKNHHNLIWFRHLNKLMKKDKVC